jgi:TolB protein
MEKKKCIEVSMILLIMTSSIFCTGGWSEFQITAHLSDQKHPAIYGDIIVWQDKRNGGYDIYGYNLLSEIEFPICTVSHWQESPAIHGSTVVWQDVRNGDRDIYGYNLSTESEFPICIASGDQTKSAIHGDIVVWQDNRNGYADIYAYDISTSTEMPIVTLVNSIQSNPAVYEHIIIWEDHRNGAGDIYGYDLQTSTEFPIVTVKRGQRFPDIYENMVVYQDFRNGNWDIYYYDLATSKEYQITTDTFNQERPAIYGNMVVWQDNRNGNLDIYGYDLQTSTEFQITTDEANQLWPDIYDNKVVWFDDRNGNNDIYGAEYELVQGWTPVKKVSTHTDNMDNEDRDPQIGTDGYGNSYVTWWGWDGTDDEIYWTKISPTGVPGSTQKVSIHPDNETNEDRFPDIAVDSAGNSHIVWRGSEGESYRVYYVRVSASGVPGPIHKINWEQPADFDLIHPRVAVDGSQNAHIVWHWKDVDYPWDTEIYYVTVSASGAVGGIQKISTHTDNEANTDYYPEIAVNYTGNTYVVWHGSDGNSDNIFWTRMDVSGSRTVLKFVNPDFPDGQDHYPQVAVDETGNSYVTWGGNDGNDVEIYGVRIDSAGTAAGVCELSTHPNNEFGNDLDPRIAVDGSGYFYVVWRGPGPDIYWVKIDTVGLPGTVQDIDGGTNGREPCIGADVYGNSYLVWTGWDGNDDEIYWIVIDTSGVPGIIEKISTHEDNETRNDWMPHITVDSSGNCYIVWEGHDGNDWEIYVTLYIIE